jgi:transcriptional regulator with XRE-family HTH domain
MDSKKIDLTRLGHRIRFLRKGKEWSLADLARESGVSKAYLSDLENGSAGKPNIQYIFAVAAALGVTLNELLEESAALVGDRRARRRESELPSGLRELQRELELSEDDVEILSQVSFRGNRPKDKEGWRFLIEALNMLGQRKPQS